MCYTPNPRNNCTQIIKHEDIETFRTRTYTSTIKNLLKSTVLKLFKELKSVSAGKLFHGATTRSAKKCVLIPRL